MMWGWGAGGWVGMGFMIVFWIAVVIGVVYLVRYLTSRPSSDRWQERPPYEQTPKWVNPAAGQRDTDALSILEQRYARGEIEREEYLQRKTDLSS